MARTASRAWLVASAMVSLMLLSACTSSPERNAPDGVTVSLVQGRTDIASGLVSIRVQNDGEETVRVLTASYLDPRFATGAEWDRATDIPAGAARALRVEVPPPDCDVGIESASGTAQLTFSTSEGETVAAYDVTDPFDFVSPYIEAACFAKQLSETATIALEGVMVEANGEGAVLEMRVTANSEDAVVLDSVDGTVLLAPDGGDEAWHPQVTVTPGTSASVELRVVPTRCDPHAVVEDKVGTRFPASITILSSTPRTGVFVIVADDAQRAALYGYVTGHCGNSP
ncbi:hypothetical protein [Microbacterium sp. A84]|uniref:hypothetical protein n=1 Tax=Microbacterium sp. A84 TaxID=3450715 RepID=UPI003F4232E3